MDTAIAKKNKGLPDRLHNAITWWSLVLFGLAALYIPTLYDLANGLWATDEQAHGPIILGIALFLIWRQRQGILQAQKVGNNVLAWLALVTGLTLYMIGRSQEILMFEIGSLIWVGSATIFLIAGGGTLKKVWFPIFFLLFMIPLPGTVVDSFTMPLKMAVSYVVAYMLDFLGYSIARSGVILQIGQYKLLVADACAGLQTLFTLEALGLLYLNIVRYNSPLRNITLAVLIVPISFMANVIRVCVLSLITYHLGDEAGQGFLHWFAGIVLFMSALLLIISVDALLRAAGSKRNCSDSRESLLKKMH